MIIGTEFLANVYKDTFYLINVISPFLVVLVPLSNVASNVYAYTPDWLCSSIKSAIPALGRRI